LLTVPSATNPAIAIADDGTVGFLYQQLLDVGAGTERWETRFRISTIGPSEWGTLVLASFPTRGEPVKQFDPYLGDKIHLLSVGNSFYGVFSAPNTPNLADFPNGVLFQRNHDFNKHLLLSVDGVTPVNVSIDPYFFHVP
jgi:hypothetical protein